VHKVVGVLLEGRDGKKVEFVVGGELVGGARDNHGGQLFVGFEEVFDGEVGDGDEVGVEVFRVADQDGGADDVDEGFCGEVAGAFALGGGEGALGLVVLGEFGLDVVVDALQFLWGISGAGEGSSGGAPFAASVSGRRWTCRRCGI
jgi:hypothetical protein